MPGPPFLRADGVELRPIEREDAAFLAETVNDPRVRKSLTLRRPVSEGEEQDWIESISDDDDIHLLICVDGDPVGNIGLHHIRHRPGTAEVGYFVASDHHGEGYATTATRLLLGYAFDELGLHRVTGKAYASNQGSRRVLEKAGFTEEGVRREDAFAEGQRVDTVVYGILADEFDA